jgi:hypothetical protein
MNLKAASPTLDDLLPPLMHNSSTTRDWVDSTGDAMGLRRHQLPDQATDAYSTTSYPSDHEDPRVLMERLRMPASDARMFTTSEPSQSWSSQFFNLRLQSRPSETRYGITTLLRPCQLVLLYALVRNVRPFTLIQSISSLKPTVLAFAGGNAKQGQPVQTRGKYRSATPESKPHVRVPAIWIPTTTVAERDPWSPRKVESAGTSRTQR